ncbi:hypothetical protein FRUB_09376 [Fimbriiglobus ruber]|uniref:Uncharacterized protein n=1 Tax=Fimbriiglobus ruber TaxID=1908690 RepID=A0A225D777_9BACT|nr:hypothetical protein FRUB_09376 [Fimbriiglobus ruber]
MAVHVRERAVIQWDSQYRLSSSARAEINRITGDGEESRRAACRKEPVLTYKTKNG